MAPASPASPRPPAASLLPVRLEMRHGAAKPVALDVPDVGFLVGTVPGCDLRLPGANLPPVLCLITRQPSGAGLRKLAPAQQLLVNGRPVSSAALADGDRVTLGPVELFVRVGAAAPPQEVSLPRPRPGERAAERDDLEQRERALADRRRELEEREVAAARQQQELAGVRRELADIRQQWHDRYRKRRDRLAGLQEAVRRASRKVQERKRRLDALERERAALEPEDAARRDDAAAQADELARERRLLDEQQASFAARREEAGRELGARLEDVERRERRLGDDRAALEKGQAQHKEDLARLDRLQAHLERRQKLLQGHALDIDRRFEQLQRDARELEEQATRADEWHERLGAEEARLVRQREELDAVAARAAQRSATVEGQQAMLATLRTRLERMREEVRREEQQLAEQREKQAAAEEELRQRRLEAERLRAELDNDRQFRVQEGRRFEEQRSVLESAVARLRQSQEALDAREEELRRREGALESAASETAEQAAVFRARNDQLAEAQQRLAAERQVLREREAALAQAEQGLAALQEQLRRRGEDLAARQRELDEQARRHGAMTAEIDSRRAEAENAGLAAEEEMAALRRRLDTDEDVLARRAAELDARDDELARRAEELHGRVGRIKEEARALVRDRAALASASARWETDRAEAEAAKGEAAELLRQLPELEARAAAALERLAQARESLREHVAELHAFASQGRDEAEALRAQARADVERVRGQELALHRARDEHRLAVTSFRQQLIEWQGQVAEMKQALARDESRLERRQAEVDEQARRVDSTTLQLARQAEALEQQQRVVAERRGEVERHLADMRAWYRQKLRELAGSGAAADEADEPAPDILSLTGDVEPGDRQLGDLLSTLGLVDADTLAALLAEARRRRRSLRQLLLAGGHLTLYQVALIEAGNLDGLMLGPVRVIDRLRVTPREAVYRVFDPRGGREAVLRHLGEAEAEDAVRPDEFRQRYAQAAAVRHPNLAATLEVLEVNGRPAVLQEWLTGLPAADWPPLTAAPGVWFRLLGQAALGLHAAHQAGLVHGHLGPGLVLLAPDGVLKLCGFGEPAWLTEPPRPEGEAPADDLAALGRMAAAWSAASRKGGKARPLPDALQAVLQRLTADAPETAYPSAAALLEDLDRAGAAAPANAEAWARFLRHVREQTANHDGLRWSA